MPDTAGSAAQHRDGSGRPKRRRLDPDRNSWSPPVGSRNARLPRDTDERTDYAGLLLAAAEFSEHEHERRELSLEDGGINGETNVNNVTTASASPSNERVELCPGYKTSSVEVGEPSDSEQTESYLVETRGPDVAQYSQLRTPKNAFGGHLSEPVQPDNTSSALPSGNRSQSTHSTLSALATGNNNQSPSAPSSTDSGSVAHEVQQGWQPLQHNVRWPRSGQDDYQGNGSYNSVSTVQPFANDAMGTEQPQGYTTGKSSIVQPPS